MKLLCQSSDIPDFYAPCYFASLSLLQQYHASSRAVVRPAVDQLLTLKLKLSNSRALKTIGKPLPVAPRSSTFLQDGDGTAKKCQSEKRIFVYVCLFK